MDEDLNKINVSVRVGQGVDIVAQAGRPKTITGFQTHNTPVTIQSGERVELGTKKYIPATTILDDVVILKLNEEFIEE
jgi:26S proteasome regulatory subunit N1